MSITKYLKQEVLKYNINLPVDKRTAAYKNIVSRYNGEDYYVEFLRQRVRDAKEIKKKQEQKEKRILEKEKKQKQEQNELRIKKIFSRLITKTKLDYTKRVIKLRSQEMKLVVLKQIKSKTKPFKITLRDLQTNITASFTFKNIYHFNTWLQKLIDGKNVNFTSGTERYSIEKSLFQLGTVKVDLLEGGYRNNKAKQQIIKLPFGTTLNCFNPISQRNNCSLECVKFLLNIDFNNKELRNKFNISSKELVSISDLLLIYNDLKKETDKPLEVIAIDKCNLELNFDTYNYILLYKCHYFVINEQIDSGNKTYDNKKTKRGTLIFDLETRSDKSKKFIINNTSAYQLEDTLCCVVYRDYKCNELQKKSFIGYYDNNNNYISSCSLFKSFLDLQASQNKFYNVWSHNGSKFDNYFLIKAFYNNKAINEIEKINLRGLSIIGMQYNSHLFKDSCCFMPNSLDNLSKNFKVKTPKLKEFKVNDKIISNTELCFYRPDLDIKNFLELQKNDKEYWNCYIDYCYADCFSLLEIVDKFTNEINSLIGKMSPKALGHCKMIKYNTIGSHSKGIFSYLNENSYAFSDYCEFFKSDGNEDDQKLLFINNFKRGGISHCNKKGKHTKGVVSVDITSQYPASMMLMKVPCGKSKWVSEYDKSKYGYYYIKNMVFDNNYFKPACGSNQCNINSLNWVNSEIKEDYIDSFMLEYLIKNCGLVDYKIEKGLVSDNYKVGSEIFGKYVMTLFLAKAEQDEYKNNNDERYNPALREVIKLYLNSLSGKLVEDPRKYGQTKFISDDNDDSKEFNGTHIVKETNDKLNMLVGLGVMVYSYSKRLLFEYINMLPEKTKNVIATETDSIYFDKIALKEFEDNVKNYSGEYPCKFGSELGNIKFEKNTDDICYFLGKKFYSIDGHHVIKGISQNTINDSGTKINLVDIQLYEDVYNMKVTDKPITKCMKVIKRVFYGITNIYDTLLTRTINSTFDYNEY